MQVPHHRLEGPRSRACRYAGHPLSYVRSAEHCRSLFKVLRSVAHCRPLLLSLLFGAPVRLPADARPPRGPVAVAGRELLRHDQPQRVLPRRARGLQEAPGADAVAIGVGTTIGITIVVIDMTMADDRKHSTMWLTNILTPVIFNSTAR